MALTVEQLRDKRDRMLKSAGISQQQSGDQRIAYSPDLAAQISIIDAEISKLEAQAASGKRIRQIRMQSSTGLD